MIAVIVIVMACCYCSCKLRQQDKEAELYWKNQNIPSSPPPPYSPTKSSGPILPFASIPSPLKTSNSRPNSRPQSPHSRSHSPIHMSQSNPTQPSAPVDISSHQSIQSIPSPNRHSRPHSQSFSNPIPNPNPNELIRHPSNQNLILPFATSPAPEDKT